MKNKEKIWKIVIIILFLAALIASIYGVYVNNYKKTETTQSGSKIEDIDIKVNTDNGEQKIVWADYENKEINLTNSISITEEGIYNLTGTISDGYIKVKTDGNVKLVLNNVSITNSNGPAIIIESAESTVIELKENSTNYLEDSSTYTGYDEDTNGVIYSKDDLIFQGTGTLTIQANYADGIVGKDDLKVISGTYNITSADDGIRGKDSVYILDGNFNIKSEGDGIKSTNDTDTEKGFVLIENGKFEIEATLDGIQAETKLIIKNGEFNIETGGGSSNASTNTSSNWGKWGQTQNTTQVENDSAKGIKSGDNLVIEEGTFNLDTSDDSIHSNNYVGIQGGALKISSGDDGIHADKEIIIENNKTSIDITKSYEGIESAKITINEGTISVVTSDDGINVAGGSDSSSMNRMGQNNFSSNTNNILTINGGNVYVNASGDGIDVNGSGYIYGGIITVDGPSDGGNSSLDYDGEFIVNGGTLIAVGASQMAQGISSSSTQYNVMINLNSSNTSGKEIKITDANGNTIISHTPVKSYSSIIVSSPNLKKSGKYSLMINGEESTSFTISSISTTVGNSGMNGNMGGGMTNGGGMNRPH